ncbi:MAG: glycine cleavage system protein H [Deltaproteobacteria bacterium]|nr:glycine cleavage system protein H [Deltaproteobacteria bacterium]
MATDPQNRRNRVGYGSTYTKGNGRDLGRGDGISTVLGGQVWKIKPDKKAREANPCLWMQAGVVAFKGCNNYYDCTSCKYDQGMCKQVNSGKQISWQNAMRRKPEMERICRHSLTKRIGNRVCAYDYQCASCDFDQYFEDVWSTKTKSLPGAFQQVKGFEVPKEYYFHNGHAWARIESGGNIRVGLDDFSLKLLGRADALDLPLMGKELDQGKVGWGLKRKDNLADVLSPIGGVIVEVNSQVREKPALANDEPYGDGWLFVVRNPNIKGAVKPLLTETDALSWMGQEVDTLEKMVEEAVGPLAADGGFFEEDIYGNARKLDWHNLTRTFLKT